MSKIADISIKSALAVYYRYLAPQRRYCCICQNTIGGFLPYRFPDGSCPAVLANLEVIGSDLNNYECPRCGASDRERHLLLYLTASNLLDALRNAHILHFAPERRLSSLIARLAPSRYLMCDLIPSSAEIAKVDMQAMPFDSNSFDFLIANHVLEHVTDFYAATAQITRVLRPGGYAILQTPYSNLLFTTFSDPGITGAENCREYYGQEDHVRLFGRDIVDQIAEATQLETVVHSHQELLGNSDSILHGVNAQEPFFLFRKPNT